jgi:hypothetical protein
MNKKLFWILTVLLLAAGTFAEAQQTKKVTRIGYLSNTDPARESTGSEAIWLALRELGLLSILRRRSKSA